MTIAPWLYQLLCFGLSAIALIAIILWLPTQLRYRITKTHFEITLFGIPLRWVRLQDILLVSKSRTRWAEPWSNTWRTSRRRIVIQKSGGLFKNILVTPQFRYEFKAVLEHAALKAKGKPSLENEVIPTETPSSPPQQP
jgi:hypothetical protein